MTFFGCVSGCLRRRDMFGKPVSLNYKGEEKFKTVLGGLLSILVVFIMIVFALDRLYILSLNEREIDF